MAVIRKREILRFYSKFSALSTTQQRQIIHRLRSIEQKQEQIKTYARRHHMTQQKARIYFQKRKLYYKTSKQLRKAPRKPRKLSGKQILRNKLRAQLDKKKLKKSQKKELEGFIKSVEKSQEVQLSLLKKRPKRIYIIYKFIKDMGTKESEVIEDGSIAFDTKDNNIQYYRWLLNKKVFFMRAYPDSSITFIISKIENVYGWTKADTRSMNW